jgi:hypothetical protein
MENVRARVEIHTKRANGGEVVIPAEFISVDMLNRIGGYQTPDSLRQKLWRLQHPERVAEHTRAWQERERQRKVSN